MEASIISNLLLICFQPSAPSSSNPSSNHILCKRCFPNHLSQKFIWSFGLFRSLRIHHQTSFVKISFILRQFQTPQFPSLASLIQAEFEDMVFIQIVALEVSFRTKKESDQFDICSSRYLQNTETYVASAKEASIISNLLLICFHPSAPSSTIPFSNLIQCKGSFTNHLSQKDLWSTGLFPPLRIHHQTSIVEISVILCQHPSSISDPSISILHLLDTSRI